ncbi:MAG: HAMP domain-containing sensor histidine kinase [Archangium sp.]|nr:HAMP domain-containing sensor histidine kinase [Archangium sp.]
MRLTVRLTLFLMAVSLAGFGGLGWYLVRVERFDLRESAVAETSLLGRSLQVAIENALRDRQVEDVQETIEKLRRVEPGLLVALLDSGGAVVAPSAWKAPDERKDLLRTLPADQGQPLIEFEPEGFPGNVVLAQRLIGDDAQVLGYLLLARPLERLNEDLRATERNVALSVVLVVLSIGLLSALAGTLFIGRPLSRLMGWMRRIRESGSLAEEAPPSAGFSFSRDEMLALEQGFGAMVVSLREADRKQAELERGLRQFDKLAAVGQLAAGLAHEIGSPLQIMCGRARVLVDQNADRPEVQRQAGILVSQGERISRIVERLLSFARVRGPLMEPHDVVPLIRSVVELLEYQARRASITLSMVSPPTLSATCDRDLLQQVALNLLTNALRAAQAGGKVIVELHEEEGNVRLDVVDSGGGIDLAMKERLFEQFFTTSPEGEGTGLGLAIVRSIVTEHGGSVDVANEAAGGARFTVKWPLTPKAGGKP